jgi:hypothetical protein
MNMDVTDEVFDPTRRRLCPDGSCIGVLDDSGRCKECGRVGGVGEPLPTSSYDEQDAGDVLEAAPTIGASGDFDPSRRLCPDGSCIGVLGPDNRCKTCGRAGDEVF